MTKLERAVQFLEPIITESARIMGLKEQFGSDDIADSQIKTSSILALSQIETYLQRPLVYAKYTIHADPVPTLPLPVIPVSSVELVKALDGGEWEELSTDDWVLVGNELDFCSWCNGDYWEDETVTGVDLLEVVFTGGRVSADEELSIYTALVLQTIANYNRRTGWGVQMGSTITGETIQWASDSGGLLNEVQRVLEPLVFYGSYEIIEVADAS